jgi:hypothetical protein
VIWAASSHARISRRYDRATHIQVMQKALRQVNMPLTQVLTDITGATGLSVIRTIVGGERDPVQLARS